MNYICRTLFQPDSQFDADEYDRLKTRMAESQSHPQPQAEIHPDARSDARSGFNPPLYLACGPLLRFTGIEDGVWHGSILVVTEDRRSVYRPVPVVRVYTSSAGTGTGIGIDAGIVKLSRTGRAMRIKSEDEVARGIDHSITADPGHSLFGAEYDIPHPNTDRNTDTDTDADAEEYLTIPAHTLHAEQAHTFFRFDLALPLSPASSTKIVYRLNGSSTPQSFYIPSTAESMHVLFHSCNGFSLSVDSGAFSGPDPLWRDVLRAHTGHSHRHRHSPRQARPFHIMLGGGDQIYNDAARTHPTTTHFHAWTQSRPLARKRSAPFSPPMRAELHRVFLRRYLWWFSQGLFAVAAAHIPSVNVWDDHDLIDGYGSYPRRTMEAPVLRGLGGVAAWYYLLFQHHVVPVELAERERELVHAHAHAHVPAHEPNARENCYITGPNPGPYIPLHSRSVFMHLGPRLAFLGIDCRMERTRTRVLSPETWEVVFQRCRREIVRGRTRHLLVMIGVPLIYPRLTPLETLLSSGLMTPLKALFRAGLVPRPLVGLFNQFDGGIELLDDLDDHWTARHHRRERASFVLALQGLAWDLRVRVTLLAGDVHLAAVGGFYTTPGFGLDSGEGLGSGEGDDGRVRRENDPRYMLNIISSAIANRPPADRVADILNRCDRVHYLGGGGKDDDDKRTREEMLDVFHVDVDGSARRNVHLLPRRNWCEISEVGSSSSSSSSGSVNSDLHVWLHAEVEQGHPGGWTRGYQVVVPGLE